MQVNKNPSWNPCDYSWKHFLFTCLVFCKYFSSFQKHVGWNGKKPYASEFVKQNSSDSKYMWFSFLVECILAVIEVVESIRKNSEFPLSNLERCATSRNLFAVDLDMRKKYILCINIQVLCIWDNVYLYNTIKACV